MLFAKKTGAEKRADLRAKLRSGKLLRFPGAFSPFIAMMAEEIGYDGIYISGGALACDLGLPDIGLTTQTEIVLRGRATARVTELPTIIDIDTGFGESMNAARTLQELEDNGLAGCHLEDQINPKRCGHLDGKQLVDIQSMQTKIKAAASARRDPNFLLMARTDARATEGLDKAIDRAKAYVDAGADMIFPEAMEGPADFEKFRKALKVPLLANMTEFGKSKLLTAKELENLGINMVIYPVTTFRLAMKAVEDGLRQIMKDGTQEHIIDKMQTRARLYEINRYAEYNAFDQNVFNFTLKK